MSDKKKFGPQRDGPDLRERGPQEGVAWRDDAHAVVIGINNYQDPKIPDLRFARGDAEAVYRVLTDPEVGRFNPENVTLLLDDDATERKIRSAIGTKLPKRATKDSTVCIYYAGHGAPVIDPAQRWVDGIEKYLIPHDAQVDDLRSSGISMDVIQQCFSWLSAKHVICFLDCCYSGAAGGRSFERSDFQTRAILSDEFLENLGGEGRLVITACATNEVSLESADRGHGVFTYYLVEGLRGAADADGNGRVTVDELYDYVYAHVENEARRMGGSMNPVRKGSVQGRVYLTEFETAIQKQIRVTQHRALTAWEAGRVEEAAEAWREIVALDPSHAEARSGLAWLTELQAQQQAAKDATMRKKRLYLTELCEDDVLSTLEYDQALGLLDAEFTALTPIDRRKRKLLDSMVEGVLTPNAYKQSAAAIELDPERSDPFSTNPISASLAMPTPDTEWQTPVATKGLLAHRTQHMDPLEPPAGVEDAKPQGLQIEETNAGSLKTICRMAIVGLPLSIVFWFLGPLVAVDGIRLFDSAWARWTVIALA